MSTLAPTPSAVQRKRRFLQEENKKWPLEMVSIPRDQWPEDLDPRRFNVWRSREFLVQGFMENHGIVRLSVIRTELNDRGEFADGLTWDQLQWIKDSVGFADRDAVELYPRSCDVVNRANMRHVWVLPEPCSWAWRKKP